jgi:uncharacterized protein (DUF1778 family)
MAMTGDKAAGKELADRRVNLRVTQELCELIDAGARAANKDRTAFMLDAARDKAMQALLEQRVFELSEEGEQQVRALFARRLSEIPEAVELMARRPQWQSEPRGD